MLKKCFECKHEKSRVCIYEKLEENYKSIGDIWATPKWCPLIDDSDDINITQFYNGVISKRGKVHFCEENVDNIYKETYCNNYLLSDIKRLNQELHLNYCKKCLNKLKYNYHYPKRKSVWLYNGKFYEGCVALKINDIEVQEDDFFILKSHLNVDLFPIRIVTMGLAEKFKKTSDDYMSLKKFVDMHHIDVKIKSYRIWLEKKHWDA